MKKKNRRFKLLPGSCLYFLLLVYSFFLTQLLRNAVSGALFMFVLILPIVSFVHCMIGKSVLQVYVMSGKQKAMKNEPLSYEIRILNSSFLSFPFVEAVISEPGESAVKCKNRRIVLSLVPFGSYSVKNTVKFKYRGLYDIGVESMYISDLFRFFAIRADMDNYSAVTVSPRRMTILDGSASSSTDAPSADLRRDVTAEKNEFSDIRNYIPGDSVRDIHWKLSSKTQDLVVKQYSSAESRHVYVLCDMAASYRPERSADDLYDTLKKYVESENRKDKRKIRIKSAPDEEIKRSIENVLPTGEQSGESGESAAAKRRRDAKYRRYVKGGMSEKDAETIRSIDELISSSSKHGGIKKKKKEAPKDTPDVPLKEGDAPVSEVQSDLGRILSMTKIPDDAIDTTGKSYGGLVKEEEQEGYDECCYDAVVEMALAVVTTELKRRNVCTIAWYDSRADRGVYSVTLSSREEYEDVASKLSLAEGVPHDNFVSGLGAFIDETTNVTVKIVTANIDPQTVAEISSVPAKFGGAGTGCSVEAIIFSPSDKYENPALREVYLSDVMTTFMSRGIYPTRLNESVDKTGAPVFAAIK